MVEGGERTESAADLLVRAGWGRRGATLDVRRVADGAEAAATVAEARRGTAVVVDVELLDLVLTDRLLADLERMGTVHDWRPGRPTMAVATLTAPQRALLGGLAAGDSVARAAANANVSIRTAHRRLADASNSLAKPGVAAALAEFTDALAKLGPQHAASTPAPMIGQDDEVRALHESVRKGADAVVLGGRGAGRTSLLRTVAATHPKAWWLGGLDLLDDSVVVRRIREGSLDERPLESIVEHILASSDPVVVVDDAHLLGARTGALVAELAGRVPMVVATADREAPLLTALPDASVLELVPLGPGPAAALAGRLLPGGSRELIEDIVALGRGIPAQIVALAAAPDQLDEVAFAALHEVAVDPTVRSVAGLLGFARDALPMEVGVDALRTVAATGLAIRRGDGMVAAGPVARRTLSELVTEGERTEVHRRLASLVAPGVAEAEHLWAAGDEGAALPIALGVAASTSSLVDRARALTVAVRCAPPARQGELLDEAVRARIASGPIREARALLDEVVAVRPELATTFRIAVIEAGLRAHSGDVAGARDITEAALAQPDLSASDQVQLRAVRWGTRLAAGEASTELLDEADVLGPVLAEEAPDLTARMMPGIAMAMQGDVAWPDILLPAHSDALRSLGGDPGTGAILLAFGTEVLAFLLGAYGDLNAAVDRLSLAIDALESVAADGMAADLRVMRAFTTIAIVGPTDRVLADLADSLTKVSSGRQTAAGWVQLAVGCAERGRMAESAAAFAEAETSRGDPIGNPVIDGGLAELRYLAGDAAGALEVAAPASEELDGLTGTPLAMRAIANWARADLGASAALAVKPVESVMYPLYEWLVFQDRAVRALAADDPETAAEEVRRALEQPGLPVRDRLRLELLLGESLGRAGKLEEARTVLDPLYAEARERDLVVLGHRVRAALRGVGHAVRSPGSPSVGLTGRELQVIGLVGEGLTTAEIAKRLLLAPSTIDTVVNRARQKLGARTRREAAALLRDRS